MRGAGERTHSGSVRLLRYRFNSTIQVSRHFHVTTGRVVLFYPTPLALRPGEPVILDVTFADSEQDCAVRGAVIGKEAGNQYVGWWLEFAAHGLVASLQTATTRPKRRQRRFPTEVVVNVERPEAVPFVAKLVDVSLNGGRITGLSLKPSVGEQIRLSLFSRDSGLPGISGRIAWTRGGDLGIGFKQPAPIERATIRSLVNDAREHLLAAYEASHPSFCRCAEGYTVLEPPLPRVAHRQTGSR